MIQVWADLLDDLVEGKVRERRCAMHSFYAARPEPQVPVAFGRA